MADFQKCARCKQHLTIDHFPAKQRSSKTSLSHTTTCFSCTEKKKEARAARQNAQKENAGAPAPNSDDDESPTHAIPLSEIKLHDFLTFLGQQKDSVTIEANVGIGGLFELSDRRKRADAIASLMWEVMNYRFLWVSTPSVF
jgi:hypothetical protein